MDRTPPSTPVCEHDWRENPHLILPTNPPQRQHVCAKCGSKKSSGLNLSHVRIPGDPKDWPRV